MTDRLNFGVPAALAALVGHLAVLLKHLPSLLPELSDGQSKYHFYLDSEDVAEGGLFYAFNRRLKVCFEVHLLREQEITFKERGAQWQLLRAALCVTVASIQSGTVLPSSGGTVMYKAPEIFKEESFNTKETDVYAFGCLAYEAFTGKPPFAKFTAHLIISKVMHGHRPKRPPNSSSSWNAWGLTEHIWMLIQRCWEETAARRPMIDAVIHRLEQALPEDI
ncbi:hypothetical protein H0H92_006423 [Tricholoma furcatifolium]|nr:hypothetical protein H0H92_006423 [Tricholoma furcatifolium]